MFSEARNFTRKKRWPCCSFITAPFRTDLKALLVLFKASHILAPSYISHCLLLCPNKNPQIPPVPFLPEVPKMSDKKSGEAALSFYGSEVDLKISFGILKSKLMTHLFFNLPFSSDEPDQYCSCVIQTHWVCEASYDHNIRLVRFL